MSEKSNDNENLGIALNADNADIQKMPTPNVPGKLVSLACRNSDCDGTQATVIDLANIGRRYTCAKCNHVWTVSVGGSFNF